MIGEATVTTYKRKDGTWWGRVRCTDPVTGAVKTYDRGGRSKSEAKRRAGDKLKELRENGGRSTAGRGKTCRDLAAIFEVRHLQPPQYDAAGNKIVGIASYVQQRNMLMTVLRHFGSRLVSSVSWDDLAEYHRLRSVMPTKHGKPRTINDVNKAMMMLRRIFLFARREGWITLDPFEQGQGKAGELIRLSHENQRSRVLTDDEEKALLAVVDERKEGKSVRSSVRFRSLIIVGLDSMMRLPELFRLRWQDVDFECRRMMATSYKGKRKTTRWVVMSDRAEAELLRLREAYPGGSGDLVYAGLKQISAQFARTRKRAGVADVIFHDLRRTGATRLSRAGYPVAEISRLLGHSGLQMTQIYLGLTQEGFDEAREIINRRNVANGHHGRAEQQASP